jgi:predicted nucleotidyltransferase
MDAATQQRGALLEQELRRILGILIEKYQPEKLIVFGSLAQGEIREWSDLDLVVIKHTDKPLLDRIEEVLTRTRPRIGLDVLVYTPEEVEAMVDERRAFILDEIIYKGAVAYERTK